MAYVSELLGRPVTDVEGEPVGRLDDLIAARLPGMPHPVVVAIVVKCHHGLQSIPINDVAVLVAPAIPLTKRLVDVGPYEPGGEDLFLARDILDKQIIDTNGVRVVRVNDLELARINHHFYIANVDVGSLGLLRRLGLARLAKRFGDRPGRGPQPAGIAWHDVELLHADEPLRLRVPGEKMSDLHPADLAELISDLRRSESDRLLATLDVKTLADTLEEVEPDFQASLVETMPDEKVADVLDEMSPDEAADLLAELPEERSRGLLELMEDDEAHDVRKLLTFPEASAGGIMTTEFVVVPPNLTAGEAIALLRKTSHEAETITYVYVTDSADHLLGVFSLAELVMANPETPIAKFMHRRVVSVDLLASQEEVAQAVSKYNLVAVPVVDVDQRIHGIVTADDALDKVIPTAWKKRLPRLYH
jgi:CBS domain-containing protein/sporulation protein YlmC with PRC-barrel domain